MGKPISEETKKLIQDLGEKGFNLAEIGNALGTSSNSVCKHIKKYNIPYEKKKTSKYTFEENCEIVKTRIKNDNIESIKENNESRKTATKHYKEWTPEDEQKLIELHKSGKTYKEISLELGRTIQSINIKICNMGIKRRKCQYLTEEEKTFIDKNYKTMTVNEMAKKLNRAKSTVRYYKFRTFKD